MRIWIDLANAPHVSLFRPIVSELRRGGHEIVLTGWDRGQTRDLATTCWPDVAMVGAQRGFRTKVLSKGAVVWQRASALTGALRAGPIQRPDVAIGHNSYSQLIAARRLGIPAVTVMDYEHQPANHLAFRLAQRVVLPEAIDVATARRLGVSAARLVRYPGVKEDVILADFRPTPGFRASLGLPEDRVVALGRPPAEGALYHRGRNDLFDDVLAGLVEAGALVVVSPRTSGQGQRFENRLGVQVLGQAVSGADLIYCVDLMIGAGGTMTREAAVLGTPAWSVFSGRPAAVDQALAAQGRLRFLTGRLPRDRVRPVVRQPWQPRPEVVERFAALLVHAAEGAMDERRSLVAAR